MQMFYSAVVAVFPLQNPTCVIQKQGLVFSGDCHREVSVALDAGNVHLCAGRCSESLCQELALLRRELEVSVQLVSSHQ